MMGPDENRRRRDRALGLFGDWKIEALVVSELSNIRYLTGFTGSNAAAVLMPGETRLFTDPRYSEQAAQECDCRAITVKGQMWPAVAAHVERKKIRRLGFEQDRIPYFVHRTLREKLPQACQLIAARGAIEKLRRVKSAWEIEAIRTSVATNSRAYEEALRRFKPGMSELDLAAEIDYRMRLGGAEGPAFETIVASGARSSLPHARPTSNPIAVNQLLLIDMGAVQNGYTSDMTRTVFPGAAQTRWKRMYGAVLEAQSAAISVIRDGARSVHPDREARRVLGKYGVAGLFTHSTGHGLGLEVHEGPRIGKRDKETLRAGMVITVEPGIYMKGKGGIRIEDTVLVTAAGCEILTPTSKELTVI